MIPPVVRPSRTCSVPAAALLDGDCVDEAPGVVGVFDRPELGEAELADALASFTRPSVVLIDDAELLRDCGAGAN